MSVEGGECDGGRRRGGVRVDSVRPGGDVTKGDRSLGGDFLSLKQVRAFIT